MGDFVPTGAPLFRVHGEAEVLDNEKIVRLVALGSERTHNFDPAFGFRKLVDIAERSVVQPFNDPTTAVQAINRLHDCLRQAGLYLFRNFHHLLRVALYHKFLIFRHQVRTLLVFRNVVRQYCWFVLGEGYP